MTYPLDKVIRPLNNWGLVLKCVKDGVTVHMFCALKMVKKLGFLKVVPSETIFVHFITMPENEDLSKECCNPKMEIGLGGGGGGDR